MVEWGGGIYLSLKKELRAPWRKVNLVYLKLFLKSFLFFSKSFKYLKTCLIWREIILSIIVLLLVNNGLLLAAILALIRSALLLMVSPQISKRYKIAKPIAVLQIIIWRSYQARYLWLKRGKVKINQFLSVNHPKFHQVSDLAYIMKLRIMYQQV